MTCDNCGRHLVDHCRVHLIPCCPGKCPADEPRDWTVVCSATHSCGWEGVRRAVKLRDAQADPCPNCGQHVRASGSPRRPDPGDEIPGVEPKPGPERYHLL